MFKLASKTTKRGPSLSAQVSMQAQSPAIGATATRSITSNEFILNHSIDSRRRKAAFDIYGEIEGNTGIVRMNKEHRYNTLTTSFMRDVSRGIESMYVDPLVSVIYLGTHKGEHFCNGTDFRSINHMKKEENFDKIAQYFEQLYQLQTQVAKTNKPIVAVAPGHSYNSGATMLAAMGYPMSTLDAKIAFNEVTFGFVPHSGATFYLSRLPGELGTFLALTGLPLHGSEAARAGIVQGIVHKPTEFHEDVSVTVSAQEFPRIDGHMMFEDNNGHPPPQHPWLTEVYEREKQKQEYMQHDKIRMLNKQNSRELQDPFAEAKDRIPSAVAEAEYEYMTRIREDYDRKQLEEYDGYLDSWKGDSERKTNFRYLNPFSDQMNYLKLQLGNQYPQSNGHVLEHRELIDRCFYGKSVEQITAALRQETHPFAKKCLEAMKANSPLSMELALRMLRQAKNLDYKGAMRMELDVAFNMIQDKEFDRGVSQVLMSPKPRGQEYYKAGFKKQVKESELAKYFEPSKWSQSVNVNVVSNALLPTRHYYERFTDQVRLWINEESTPQEHLRHSFEQEAKEALREQGIDVRDKSLTIENARDHLAGKLATERVSEEHSERMEQLMTDTKLRDKYYGQIKHQVAKIGKDSKVFYNTVNKYINDVFVEAYLEKLNKMFSKSQEANNLEKRRMLIRFKKFLFKSRILTYWAKENEQEEKLLKNMPFKQIHLTEKWDETYQDMSHPQIEKAPMWHLMKAVGKVSLTTPQMVKVFLTDVNQRDNMSMLTFNKEELLKIQDDVYADPEKYVAMFTRKEPSENDPVWHEFRAEYILPKEDDKDYWYRVLNDGYSPRDSMPYQAQYLSYKEWADNVEERALETLKMATSLLLKEHETFEAAHDDERRESGKGEVQPEVLNHKFGRHKDETKFNAIRRLHTILNQDNRLPEVVTISEKPKNKRALNEKRSLESLEELLLGNLQKDEHLKMIFGDRATENAHINKFRDEAFSELLKLLEITLLDKPTVGISANEREALEKRLTDLTTPKNFDQKRANSLRVIDAHLSATNGEAAVEEALQLIRPFFIQQFYNRVNEEAEGLMSEFRRSETNQHVLVHFLMSKKYPEFQDNPFTRKFLYDSDLRERKGVFEAANPLLSENYLQKTLISNLGTQDPSIVRESYTAQIESSMKTAVDGINKLSEFAEHYAKFNEEYEKEEKKHRDDDLEWETSPRFEEDSYSPDEWKELESWEFRTLDCVGYIQHMRYEIENNMSIFDWCKIYADTLLEQNIDMNIVLKQFHMENQDEDEYYNWTQYYGDEEWKKMGEYAKFIHDFAKGLSKYQDDPKVDLIKFMTQNSGSGNTVEQESIFQRAISARNQNQKDKRDAVKYDRFEAIRGGIEDFNTLQSKKSQSNALKSEILKLATKRSQKELVRKVLKDDESAKYVDLESLRERLAKGEEVDRIEDVINSAKLIADFKKGQALQSVSQEFADTKLDVLSLVQTRSIVNESSTFSDEVKAQVNSVIDHVDQQTKYISNKERSEINLTDFLQTRHYTASDAYENYTSDILRNKLKNVIGQAPEKADVDWEFLSNRTNPKEHADPMSEAELSQYIDDVEAGVVDPDANDEIEHYNETLQENETTPVRFYETQRLLRDAKELTEFPEDLTSTKNLFENQMLRLLGNEAVDQVKVEALLQEYLQIRVNTAMLNQDFQQKLTKGDNGHYYLKMLKERVIGELNLDEYTDPESLSYDALHHESQHLLRYDIESPYNLQQLNNTDALGYDNLLGRAAASTPSEKADAAQQNVFEKLLADYFLTKRGDYAESNKLARDLAAIFDDQDGFTTNENKSLQQRMLESEREKVDEPIIDPMKFRNLIELDSVTQRALQNNKTGLSQELRGLSIKDTDHPDYFTTQIPEYFEIYDVRKPADVYVQDKLKGIVSESFEARRRLEKGMTRRELLAFDKTLAAFLKKESLMPRLKRAVESDYNNLHHGRSVMERAKDYKEDEWQQGLKTQNLQREYNKRIQDEDAEFKLLAYNGMLDKINREKYDKQEYREIMWNTDSFECFYQEELERKAKTPPRKINPDDFVSKKPWEMEVDPNAPWRDQFQRESDFKEEHSKFLENKKEQQDRIQLFYVMEQFFEHARTNPDPMSDAQEHMKEYFADPENTFFFDKNKIY